jgi:hypothetical protein
MFSRTLYSIHTLTPRLDEMQLILTCPPFSCKVKTNKTIVRALYIPKYRDLLELLRGTVAILGAVALRNEQVYLEYEHK